MALRAEAGSCLGAPPHHQPGGPVAAKCPVLPGWGRALPASDPCEVPARPILQRAGRVQGAARGRELIRVRKTRSQDLQGPPTPPHFAQPRAAHCT